MNTTKVKAAVAKINTAVEEAQKEITTLTTDTITAGQKDPVQFNGLQPLGNANMKLESIKERLTSVLEQVDKASEKANRRKDTKEEKAAKKETKKDTKK